MLAIRQSFVCALALIAVACKKPGADDPAPVTSAENPTTPSASASAPSPPPETPPTKPDPTRHVWLTSPDAPAAVDTLSARFATPPGYQRVAVEPGSFAAWLRDLPLMAPGTPVLSFKGEEQRKADDEYLAAVVALDIGKIDLQQSPDLAVRLHAEWLWSQGNRDISYRGATGLDIPLSRWARGERVIAEGRGVFWIKKAKAAELDHAEFRRYLDAVFTWANSTSLAQQAKAVEPNDLQAGDFFVHLGSPGHTLVVLDVAERKEDSRRLALFGQALNPAQNMFVLKLGSAGPWFSLRSDSPLITPYTDEFPWAGLRRFPAPEGPASETPVPDAE